ncbi:MULTISPECIES: autotransporter outer membrane beta-barrel domain-containing protein [unclassified Pseudomonas]|uniref:autotransporter outer membrane beta-barrel domain-containing protein n=1 Tax=unclassified Pseudomonas TaxID=196821 RepID=UPI001CC8F58B|nr:autotransporter outer membrane beta-barrel domain-containing protein [Pseudomonas sp. P116]
MKILRTKLVLFSRGPITFMALSPLLFISPPLMALTSVGAGENVTIVDSTPVDNYLVRNGGVLNTENAQTHEVFVQSGSTINATGGAFVGRNRNSGITLTNSQASLTGVTLSSDGSALTLRREIGSPTGSSAVVTDSVIRGGKSGVLITGLSTLELNGGEVTGLLADSVGIDIFAGEVRANGTTISGGANGVRMAASSGNLTDTLLTLNGATLEGRESSAILVQEGVQAQISVLNNSQLLAGNGILLDVQDASAAAMTVIGSALQGNINVAGGSTANLTFDQSYMTGDVLVDDSSKASLTLDNHSQFTGRLDNVASVILDNSSQLTGQLDNVDSVTLQNHSQLSGHLSNVDSVIVDNSSRLTGDLENIGSVTLQNRSELSGNLENVDVLALDNSSQFTGHLDHVDSVTLDNYSQLTGDLENVGSVALQNHSQLTGDLESVDGVTLRNRSQLTGRLNNVDSVTLQDHSQLTGRLDNVGSVNISSNSNWTMTANGSIGALSLDGGSVTFGAADAPTSYRQLNVGTLSGNGTFVMKGDFASGERDFLNVTGASAGDFGLAVAASGLDAASPQQLILARTATIDAAQFALAGNGVVDVGTWSYSLNSRENDDGGKDWFLDPATEVISPGASSVLALFNTAPTVWYGELSSLRSRMGELRFNGGEAGGWIRTYGNKYNVAAGSGVGYQQQQQGLSLGADARIGESQVLVGVLAGTSKSDLDLDRGTSGTVKSYYVGPYVTWLDSETGYYFDGVLKFNRFRNESKVNLSDGSRTKGDYDNWGVGASAEFGRHIKLADDYFIEPFTQLSAVQIQGKQYTLDNDMDADGDRMRSLVAKAGATVGRNFAFNDGAIAQPYLRAAVAHEFASNNEVKVNDNVFNNDLSGSRAEFGAGVAVALSAKWQVHADFDYSKGEHIEQPWGANVGVRFNW